MAARELNLRSKELLTVSRLRMVKENTDRGRAIDVLKQGLSVYPADPRLQNTLFNLQKEDPRSFAASAIGVGFEEKEAKTVVYPVDLTEASPFLAPPPVKPPAAKTFVARQPTAKPVANKPAVHSAPPKPSKPPGPPRGKVIFDQFRETGALFVQNIKGRLGSQSHTVIGVVLGLLASVIILGVAYRYLNRTENTKIVIPPPTKVREEIHTIPADATATLDGNPVSSPTPPLEKGSRHKIVVSRLGYHPSENSGIEVTGKPWEFSLTPEPLHLAVSLSQPNGSVWLDNERVGALEDGIWNSTYPVKQNDERRVKGNAGEQLFKIAYTMGAGKPAVLEPLDTKDLIVTSSLGKDATVYTGNRPSKLVIGSDGKVIPAEGLALNVDEVADGSHIVSGKHSDSFQVSASSSPELSVTLNVSVTSSVKNATLTIDGEKQRPKRAGYWSWALIPGGYKAKLTAPGMMDEEFPIKVRKGATFVTRVDMRPIKTEVPMATLVIVGGTPGADVKVDGESIGTLNSQGNLSYTGVTPQSHEIQISLDGYHPFSSRQNFIAGKPLTVPNVPKLLPETGYVRIVSIQPANATLYYKRSGDSDSNRHQVSDFSKVITLQPGSYEFTADATRYLQGTITVKVKADQTADVTLHLPPVSGGTETNSFFDNPDDVVKVNGDWYHGKTANYIGMKLPFRKNTILFSKDYKRGKMSWTLSLDADNSITYTLDSKKVVTVQRVNGDKLPPRTKNIDTTGASTDKSWVVVIVQEKGSVNILKQDGTVIDSATDDKHDWSHAKIYIKGDNYFTAWPGK